jgi:hypothetical protein
VEIRLLAMLSLCCVDVDVDLQLVKIALLGITAEQY